MTVYVDQIMRHVTDLPWKNWCHMYADTEEELHELAAKIGLKCEWFQAPDPQWRLPHYDIIPPKRKLAIRYGAVSTDREHVASFIDARRVKFGLEPMLEKFKRVRAEQEKAEQEEMARVCCEDLDV